MSVKMITINAEGQGQRLDNFLFSLFRKVPKSRIYRAIRKGEVRVNKRRVNAKYRLLEGDCLRIPPLRVPSKEPVAKASAQVRKWLSSLIVYEDSRMLLLNKPSGLSVHGGSGQVFGVQEVLKQMRPDAARIELVHRLDKGTSGCLILAKDRSILTLLQNQFRMRHVQKEYIALVKGVWRGGERRVEVPLLKKELSNGEKRIYACDEKGKPAVSIFKPLKVMAGMSLVQVKIETGRMHQIRVHAHYLGHPVAGDSKYGCDYFNKILSERGLKRLFLHSLSLGFPRLAGEIPFYAVSIQLPEELVVFLEKNNKN